MLYKSYILTGMRKLLITLDDELDKELAKYPNQNEIVREALRLYKLDISTDTVAGLRVSYKQLLKIIDERFSFYDEKFERMDKLLSYLETRM